MNSQKPVDLVFKLEKIPVGKVNDLLEAKKAFQFLELGEINENAVVIPIEQRGAQKKYLVLRYVATGWFSGPYFTVACSRLVPSTMSMKQAADTCVFSPARCDATESTAAGLTFTLHMLPLGAATDNTLKGNYKEAAVSVVADAAMLLTGPASLLAKTAGGAKKIKYSGILLETSVGIYRGGQGVVDIYNGNYVDGAGEFGEALLRLFGVKIIRLRSAKVLGRRIGTGGRFANVRSGNIGGEVHYIPPKSLIPWKPNDGPAIWMETADHKLTASWGNSRAARTYRQRQRNLIKDGKLRQAVQMDIDDIRANFPNKYDESIQEMLDYLDLLLNKWKITMTNWEIHPFTGFGPLRFGQSRAEVRRHLGDDYLIFRKAPGVETETDSYNELGLHLYYDTEECLEFVEAFSPCEAEYSCVRVLRPSLRAVLKDLEELGLKHRYDDQGYFFDDMGFALFATGETVEGVSVYRKGYYDE